MACRDLWQRRGEGCREDRGREGWGRGWSSGRCLGRLAGRESSRCGEDAMEGKKPSPRAAGRCWFFSPMYIHHSAVAVSSGGNRLVSKWSSFMSKRRGTAAGGRQLRGEPLLTLSHFNPCVNQSVQAPFLWGGFGPCQLWNHIRCALVIGDMTFI